MSRCANILLTQETCSFIWYLPTSQIWRGGEGVVGCIHTEGDQIQWHLRQFIPRQIILDIFCPSGPVALYNWTHSFQYVLFLPNVAGYLGDKFSILLGVFAWNPLYLLQTQARLPISDLRINSRTSLSSRGSYNVLETNLHLSNIGLLNNIMSTSFDFWSQWRHQNILGLAQLEICADLCVL